MKVLAEDLHTFFEMCHAAGAPVKVTGEPGGGKSKMSEQYARDMAFRYREDGGYGCFIFDLSCANIADWMGYLMPTTVTDTDVTGKSQEVLAARYTYPYWAYDVTTREPAYKFKRGVIILEEWGQGDGEVKRACAPLINDRRIGLWRFDGFDIIILSNRPEDRSGVTKEYDFLINRWVEIELQSTLKNFLEVGHRLGLSPLTLAFAARNEKGLFQTEVPKKQGPWLTQRSLHKLDDIVRSAQAKKVEFGSPMMLAAAVGTIGLGEGPRYVAFADARSKIPPVALIVSDPMGAPVPHEPDVLMFLVYDLASKTKRDNISAIAKYVRRLQSDMAVTYFFSATARDKTLVSTSEFSSFAQDNLSLLSAVAARR